MFKTGALAPLALAFTLAGCISFGAKPPPSLLTLQPATAPPIGQVQTASAGSTITIAVPSVPQEIAGLRVPVRSGATSVAYLKDALWVEAPNRLFARLVADTVTTRTGRVVIGSRTLTDPGAALTGELRSFGVDADDGSAVVTFDAALVRQSGAAIEKRRFEARVPTGTVTAVPVGVALNQAANQVAGEVADWVGR